METQAHNCPMFTPIGSVSESGGTSCGNCEHFNVKHVEHTGKAVCRKYDELVAWCNSTHSTPRISTVQ
jgi:hypothetical protein